MVLICWKPLLNEGVPHAYDWRLDCPELSKGRSDVIRIAGFLIGNTISEKEHKEECHKGVEELVGVLKVYYCFWVSPES